MSERQAEVPKLRTPEPLEVDNLIAEVKGVGGASRVREWLIGAAANFEISSGEQERAELLGDIRSVAQQYGEGSKTRERIMAVHNSLRREHRAERRPVAPEKSLSEPSKESPRPSELSVPPTEPREEPQRGPKRRLDLKLDPWMTNKDDLATPEIVQPKESEESVPNYGSFDNINQAVFAVRRQLNDAIINNNRILPGEKEDLVIRRWIRQAEEIAKKAGGEETTEHQIFKDLREEYQAVREILSWWHDGVLSHKEPTGKGFGEFQNRGIDFTSERIRWLKKGYRSKEFITAFAQPCPNLEIGDYKNPNNVLGAMWRMGTGTAIKDGAIDNIVALKMNDGKEIWVINNPVSINPHLDSDMVRKTAEKGSGYLYEMYRIFNLDAYAAKYLKTRHSNMIYALEFSHMALLNKENKTISLKELLRLPKDERVKFGWDPNLKDKENLRLLVDQQVPVFINHLSQKMTGFYTFWQQPEMAGFWHANILNLEDRQKIELGWDPDLGLGENKMRLGFLELYNKIKNLAIEERSQYGWSHDLSGNENWENLSRLAQGLNKKESDAEREEFWRESGLLPELMKEFKENFTLLKKNLINLRTGDVKADEWLKFDWDAFMSGTPLVAWGQRLRYMQNTMKDLVSILRGTEVTEMIRKLGSGEGMQYIPDELAYVKERERIWWANSLSETYLYSYLTFREKGNRHPLAVEIRGKIREFFYRGFLRKFDFLACGIKGMDWVNHPERMMGHEKEHLAIRQLLQRLSEVKIIRDGILKEVGIDYKDFVNFAGLEIKEPHFDFIEFGKELNTTADLDILRQYFAISKENRGRLLESLGSAFKLYELARLLRAEGEEQKAGQALKKAAKRLKKAKKNLIKDRKMKDLDDQGLLEWYQKIKNIHFKEEIETEVDLGILQEYLTQPEGQRKEWLVNNIDVTKANKAEKICQVWAEFEEMNEQDRKGWLIDNRDKSNKIRYFLTHWPGRHGWNRMEQGELITATWVAIDKYLSQFYENNTSLKKGFFGLWYDIWEREKRLFRVMRRQKASMDLRKEDDKRWIFDVQKVRTHAMEDVIIGRYIHDQLEWDEEHMEFFRHEDRMTWDKEKGIPLLNNLRGLDRLASMMMGTGEFFPGSPLEVSPLYYGHDNARLLRRIISRQTIGYRFEQGVNESRRLGLTLKNYWETYRPEREVMTPEKIGAILRGLYSQGTISDFGEYTDYQDLFGCTEEEVQFFRSERRQARVRDIEDKAEQGVEAEFRATMDKALAVPAVGGVGAIFKFISGGQTGRERIKIIRNGGIGFAIPLAVNALGVFWGWPFFSIPGIGIVLAVPTSIATAYYSFDAGDQQRGIRWITSRFLRPLMKERENRRDPHVMKRGYTIPSFLGKSLLSEKQAAFSAVRRLFLIPSVWDDWVDGAGILQTVDKAKKELGSEGSEKH